MMKNTLYTIILALSLCLSSGAVEAQQFKEAGVADIVYFWFASNDSTGTAADGATPLYDVRLGGAASGAAPTASGTPTLLSHANFSDGLYEIAIDTTGYATGEYAVFCTLAVSAVNPAGFVGSVKVMASGETTHDIVSNILTDTGTTLDALIRDVPTVAEFEARTIAAADYVVVTDTIAGVTTATSISANGLSASSLASDAVAEIQVGLATEANQLLMMTDGVAVYDRTTDSLQAQTDSSVSAATIVDNFYDELLSGHTTPGTGGEALSAIKAKTDNLPASPAAVGSNMGTVSSVTGSVGSVTGMTASDVGAIKTVTDKLNTTLVLDGAVYDFTAAALEAGPGGGSAPTAVQIRQEIDSNSTQLAAIVADTNELQQDWSNGGRLDLILDAAGSAGDPWIASLPGAYLPGSAGYIIGTEILGAVEDITGSGAYETTITIRDNSGNIIPDCEVWITSDAAGNTRVAGPLYTDDEGEVEFYLNDGATYYLWRKKAGYNFSNPTSFVAVRD